MSERAHTCTTPRVLEYAREAFRRDIADLLDDPTDLLHPWRDREPPEALTGLRGLAQDLGLDFDALIAGGTPFERERLASIEQSLTQPAPKEEMPQTTEA